MINPHLQESSSISVSPLPRSHITIASTSERRKEAVLYASNVRVDTANMHVVALPGGPEKEGASIQEVAEQKVAHVAQLYQSSSRQSGFKQSNPIARPKIIIGADVNNQVAGLNLSKPENYQQVHAVLGILAQDGGYTSQWATAVLNGQLVSATETGTVVLNEKGKKELGTQQGREAYIQEVGRLFGSPTEVLGISGGIDIYALLMLGYIHTINGESITGREAKKELTAFFNGVFISIIPGVLGTLDYFDEKSVLNNPFLQEKVDQVF